MPEREGSMNCGRIRFATLLFLSLAAAPAGEAEPAPEPGAEDVSALEASYERFCEALKAGDPQEFKRVVSGHYYARLCNFRVSHNRALDAPYLRRKLKGRPGMAGRRHGGRGRARRVAACGGLRRGEVQS